MNVFVNGFPNVIAERLLFAATGWESMSQEQRLEGRLLQIDTISPSFSALMAGSSTWQIRF